MIKRIPQSILLRQAIQNTEKELDAEYPDALQAMLKAIEACKRGEDVKGVNEDNEDE
jgi:hypothetical protein